MWLPLVLLCPDCHTAADLEGVMFRVMHSVLHIKVYGACTACKQSLYRETTADERIARCIAPHGFVAEGSRAVN